MGACLTVALVGGAPGEIASEEEVRSGAMASTQLRHFLVRAAGDGVAEDALNRFLRGHQVLELRQEFVPDGSNSAWCIAVRYAEPDGADGRAGGAKRPRIDYKDELEPEAFARFVELRKRRKAIAEEAALPAFAVFTDEELADIARLEAPGLAELRSVKGVGAKKVERFGARLLGINEEQSDAARHGTV